MSNKLFILLLLILSLGLLVSYKNTDSTRITNRLNNTSPTESQSVSPSLNPSLPEGVLYARRVIDGDTIELSTGEIVRYIGINTPEMTGKNKVTECFAIEAFQANKALVEDKEVKLEKDVSGKDKYGRLLRYVYVADPSYVKISGQTQKNIFVNDYLVRKGYAQVATYPPDVKYMKIFLDSQRMAKKELSGLWHNCKKNTSKPIE